MRNPFRACAAACLALILLSCRPAPAQTALKGWTVARPVKGVMLFAPPDLKPGEVFTVTVYTAGPLAGRSLEDHLREAVEGDPVKPGVPGGAPTMLERKADNTRFCTQNYTAGDRTLTAIYATTSVDGENADRVRTVYSDEPTGPHQAGAIALLRASLSALKRLSRAKEAASFTPGGKIVEGVYVGDSVAKDGDGKDIWRNPYRLYLYADGEFRVNDDKDED